MTDKTFTTADYPEIRRRGVELHTRIFKTLGGDNIKICGRQLGILQKKTLVIGSDNEMDLFTDYSIYDYRPHGFNMAERYLRLHKNKLDDFEQALLRHMSLAHFGFYQVEEANGADTLRVVDVFSKASYNLFDYQMAKTANQGLILAGHLIDFDGFSIQSGAMVLVTKEILQAEEVVRIIDRIDDDQVANFLHNPANAAKLARAVISATLRQGQATNVGYHKV